MRILIVTPARDEEPRDGLVVRTNGLIEALQPRIDLRIHRLSFPQFRPFSLARTVMEQLPMTYARWRDEVPKILKEVNDFRPDVIHLDSIGTVGFAKNLPNQALYLASVSDSYGLFTAWRHDQTRTVSSFARAWWAARSEPVALSEVDLVDVVSSVDRDDLRGRGVTAPIRVIPNGVRLDSRFDDPSPDPNPTVVFHGNLAGEHRFAVRRLLDVIWPRVLDRLDSARLLLIGPGLPTALARKAEAMRGVTYLGEVEEVSPYLYSCSVIAVPVSKPGGISNKLLEGLAAGSAVVAFEEVKGGVPELRDGIHCLLARDDDAFSRGLVRLLGDRQLRHTLGKQGRLFVKQHYSWEGVAEAYLAGLDERVVAKLQLS